MSRVVMIGDSLTEYGDWDHLLKGFKVLNLGISGETARGLYLRMPLIKEALIEGDRLFIMSGINDILMDEDDVVFYLDKVVQSLKDISFEVSITLQTILPVCGDFLHYLEVIGRNNSRLKSLAEQHGVGFLDIYSDFIDELSRPIERLFTDDGVHLSDAGYEAWAKRLRECLLLGIVLRETSRRRR